MQLSSCDILVDCFESNDNVHDWSTCMENEVSILLEAPPRNESRTRAPEYQHKLCHWDTVKMDPDREILTKCPTYGVDHMFAGTVRSAPVGIFVVSTTLSTKPRFIRFMYHMLFHGAQSGGR